MLPSHDPVRSGGARVSRELMAVLLAVAPALFIAAEAPDDTVA